MLRGFATVSTRYVARVYLKAEFRWQPPESRHFEDVTFARSIITPVRYVFAADCAPLWSLLRFESNGTRGTSFKYLSQRVQLNPIQSTLVTFKLAEKERKIGIYSLLGAYLNNLKLINIKIIVTTL